MRASLDLRLSRILRSFPAQEDAAMTLRCRPRAGGDHTPQRGDVAGPARTETFGDYGSPPARGRQRLGSCQRHVSTLTSRKQESERRGTYVAIEPRSLALS